MKFTYTLIFLISITFTTTHAKDIAIKTEDRGATFFIQSDSETMDRIGEILDDSRTFFREVDLREVKASMKDDIKDEYRERKGQVKDQYRKRKGQVKEAYHDAKSYVKKVVVKLKNGARVIFIDTPKEWIAKIKDYFEKE